MRHKTVFIFRDGAYKFSQKCFFFTLRKRKLQLGGLLHIDDTMIRYDVSWVYDMNDMTNPGYYSLNKDETKGKNYPPDLKYGGLVVFAVRGGVWILQIAFSVYGLVYSRTRTENVNSWSEWSRL